MVKNGHTVTDKNTQGHALSEYGLYDIYGMHHIPWWQRKEVGIIASAVIACIVLGLLTWGLVWYRSRRPALSAGERASRAILGLKPLIMCDPVQGDLFYIRISAVLKQYLHDRYDYPVQASTDAETIRYLQQSGCDQQIVDMVTDVLQGGVHVKFAGQKTIKENMERHSVVSIDIVHKTMPHASK